MTDRSEYAPINGTRGGATSSPMVTALLVVIAVLSLVIIALCVIVRDALTSPEANIV